jgi:hypothetical protein
MVCSRDTVERGDASYTSLVTHQSLGNRIDLMEGLAKRLEVLSRQLIVLIADVGLRTGWKTANSAIPAEPVKLVNTIPGAEAAIATQEMP